MSLPRRTVAPGALRGFGVDLVALGLVDWNVETPVAHLVVR